MIRVLLCALPLAACKPPAKPAVEAPNPLARQLAGARYDAARIALEKNQRNEALLLLISSLKADPAFPEAIQSLRVLLAGTRWHYPAGALNPGLPVEQMTLDGSHLWTSVSGGREKGGFNTTARWNLDTGIVEAVLFPRAGEETKSLVLSPDHTKLIVQRGVPGDSPALLCDAMTLKPIAELGRYPENLSLPTATAFSANGLLLAHPETRDNSLVWHIKDTATGEILRSAAHPAKPTPTGVSFDAGNLLVQHADGTVFQIPISPVKAPSSHATEIGTPQIVTPASGTILTLPYAHRAPIHALGKITAFAYDSERVFIAEDAHGIQVYNLLPAPKTTGRGLDDVQFDATCMAALEGLGEALTGLEFNELSRSFTPLAESRRRKAIDACSPQQLSRALAGLDFSGIRNAILEAPFKAAAPDGDFLLRDRITRADNDRPLYLALKSDAPPTPSPQDAIRQVFETADSEKVIAAIKGLPPKSPAISTALALALDSQQPEWITACLESATGVPPFLKLLSISRIAWLEGRKADALALWKNGFPDIATIRRREDWDGWESTDFAPQTTVVFSAFRSELAAYEVLETTTPGERQKLVARLLDPAASRAIGKERHAASCLQAAEIGAEIPEEKENVFKLTVMARALGAAPAACTRAEAHTLSNGGDFGQAHELWISLITDFPIEEQESRDYAEAAYTAFENGNGDQAMSILGTGITHFPNDADFAYRAGWISLLTSRYREAYEFLLAGDHLGYPQARLEKATALLAIAAASSGEREDAISWYQDLLKINPEWSTPEPPKAAEWPEELKTTLRQITDPPKALPVSDE